MIKFKPINPQYKARCSLAHLTPLHLTSSHGLVHGHCQPLVERERSREAEAVWTPGASPEGRGQQQSTSLPVDLVPAALQNGTGTARALVPGTCRALASLSSTRDVKSSHEKTSLLVLIHRQRSARRALKNTNCINRCSSVFFLDDKKRR